MREAMPPVTPSGPKMREWGKPQQQQNQPAPQAFGKGVQGYSKPVGFVKAGGGDTDKSTPRKTDEEMERERKEARKRDEEVSFRDVRFIAPFLSFTDIFQRERRYEPRERSRINALERAIFRVQANKEAEERDRIEMRARLDVWDDDESDELFYVDRPRWRQLRARRLEAEEAADAKSRRFEEQEAENLRRESEDFLARQMDEMQALAEEQRKAGMLLDDGAPLKLTVTMAKEKEEIKEKMEKATVFAQDEEDEDAVKKRKVPLVKLDFSVAESGEQARARLEKIRESVPTDKETLFKSKVRWDGLSDVMIDRKLEPLVKRLMVKYLGEMEEEDLIMFVLEHLKDHKGPQKLVEGLEPVRELSYSHSPYSM